jgi:hypothetical protein
MENMRQLGFFTSEQHVDIEDNKLLGQIKPEKSTSSQEARLPFQQGHHLGHQQPT